MVLRENSISRKNSSCGFDQKNQFCGFSGIYNLAKNFDFSVLVEKLDFMVRFCREHPILLFSINVRFYGFGEKNSILMFWQKTQLGGFRIKT